MPAGRACRVRDANAASSGRRGTFAVKASREPKRRWKLIGASASGWGMTLVVGDKAPNFTLSSGSGEKVTLSDLLAKRSVVLFFYPKDDTPGCTVEACTFRDHYEAFQQAGAEVVGVSSDGEASHTKFASKHRLPMTLLTDPDGKVRSLFGVQASLLGLLPGRVTFVIDRAGTIRHVFESQLRVKSHVEQALEVVRRLEPSGTAAAQGV